MAASIELVHEATVEKLKESFGCYFKDEIIIDIINRCNYNVYESTLEMMKLLHCFEPEMTGSKKKKLPIRKEGSYHSTDEIADIMEELSFKKKNLIIMRGLPGSGKSFLAESILQGTLPHADTRDHIIYSHKSKKSPTQMLREKIEKNTTPLIIDMCNIKLWDMQSYAQIAVQYKYKIHILEANTKWSKNVKKLEKKTNLETSREQLQLMMDIYDENISAEFLLTECGLTLKYQFDADLINNKEIVLFKPKNLKKQELAFGRKIFEKHHEEKDSLGAKISVHCDDILDEEYLFRTFSYISKEIILELLWSNNYDFDQTEEDLLVAFENQEANKEEESEETWQEAKPKKKKSKKNKSG